MHIHSPQRMKQSPSHHVAIWQYWVNNVERFRDKVNTVEIKLMMNHAIWVG